MSALRRPKNGIIRRGGKAYHGTRSRKFDAFMDGRPEATSADEKKELTALADRIDEDMGFARYEAGRRREGWLVSIRPTSIHDARVSGGRAAVDCYFIENDGATFKATVEYEPYFLVACRRGRESEVEEWCKRVPGGGVVRTVGRVEKEDLNMPNHLLGYRRTFLKLNFANVQDLMAAKRDLMPIAERNGKNMDAMDTYAEVAGMDDGFDLDEARDDGEQTSGADASDFIVDIREYDVPYHVRVMIDKGIRVGAWYFVEAKHGVTTVVRNDAHLAMADPVVLAFDIETTKPPLKFPDATVDQIMMISYMIDGQGMLITNREVVSADISDFEYTPKPEYPGPFMIFNEPNERAVIERFFQHVREARPTVVATYNGDFFDWPFVETRASVHGIDMYREIGWRKDESDQYGCAYGVHMDCLHWVNRDSYLPQGSRGLKAVTVVKLGYDPDELDPELMTPYAVERPQTLAEYSVSDAVATYYLYMKYVHPFVFSLCTILPLGGDDTLRKGTGTLCEMLLMVQAYEKGIVLPNKHVAPTEAFYEGHLLDSETYVGGHVESIEAGVFRADVPVNFAVDAGAVDELLADLDASLRFSITVEERKKMEDVIDYDEVRGRVAEKLQKLRDEPNRNERPLIYHLDVASMYPNIMITNRLQPDSMVQESDCAACDFNRPDKNCDRRLPWAWRGEYLPAKRDEYNMVRGALENETFPGRRPDAPSRRFHELSADEQANLVRQRLRMFSQKVYHKIHDSTTKVREAIICQRENPFYIDTVRDFRDRRYDHKARAKTWKGKVDTLRTGGASGSEVEAARKMVVLYDSLQLAHKVILNSFYGYVMRKGSRWYSLEMAGVTCLTGAHIIQMAKELVERLGRPLELDTDGIWCMLPQSFPENISFTLRNGKKMTVSYPCVMLNYLVHGRFTNAQYQTLKDARTHQYETRSDNSIFFEVDGPYRAMILPTSKEEDKNLKKRYAVFNHDGSLAELKGFEVKRRGELKLIKIFQQQVFGVFLEGTTLQECYGAVARVADRWLDVLHGRGRTLQDEELMALLSENRNMKKRLAEYGTQKSSSITTARRLADFLGEQMVRDEGLNCHFIICSRPRGAPVTERAVPVAIFQSDEATRRTYLRKWLKEDVADTDPRALLDWDYYIERLASVIQKLITIPAALQKVANPVPRVPHPEWLQRRVRAKEDKMKQKKLTDLFPRKEVRDVEDMGAPLRTRTLADVVAASQKPPTQKPDKAAKADPLPPKVSAHKDYPAFLEFQKAKWKRQRQARKRRRHLFGDGQGAHGQMRQALRHQAEALYRSTWQILQLRASDMPGEVKAFVLLDGRVHSVTVRVPRQVYLNLKADDLPDVDVAGCKVEQVNHALPHGHTSAHLFRLTVADSVFLDEGQAFARLFGHPSVEGVYERQLPLYVRALLQLGNRCTLDEAQRGVLGRGLEHGFDMEGLRRPDKAQTYLEDASLTYLHVVHVGEGERQMFGVFPSTHHPGHLVVLHRRKDQGHDLPNVGNLYAEMLKRRREEADDRSEAFEYPEQLKVQVTHVTTRRRAILAVGDLVTKMRRDEAGPVVVVVESPERDFLLHEVPILNDVPVLALKCDRNDSALPPLGWQVVAARRLVQRFLGLGRWLGQLTALARHGDVPLCNLDRDDPRFLMDVAYARRLQASGVVLWWSEGPRPDHAGYEVDDGAGLDRGDVAVAHANNPGTYATVCVDVDVRNLAVNTLLTSSLVEGDDEADSMLDDGFAGQASHVLRALVRSWWAEACRGGSPMADFLVSHLVRWLEQPSSRLYDAALARRVQLLSRAALQQLAGELRRVGARVIFASSARLLLQTAKHDVQTALAYARYVLRAVRERPAFCFVDFDVREYWDYLVWYDEHNYGGVGCAAPEGDDHDKLGDLHTVMHWQMASFLPSRHRSVFHDWVIEFVHLMHAAKQRRQAEDGVPKEKDDAKEPILLGNAFEKPLKKVVAGLMATQRRELLHPELASDHEFPELAGSHLPRPPPSHAVLELVKALMAIVALDRNVATEARELRRDLLDQLNVREFSKSANFTDPSASLPVVGVACENCAVPRAMDLCRDEDLAGEWQCGACGEPYDRLAIEEGLVGEVQGLVVAWAGMDLKCVKCGALRVSDFMEHCSCGGAWREMVKREHVVKRLGIYGRVAKVYRLSMLGEVVEAVRAGLVM